MCIPIVTTDPAGAKSLQVFDLLGQAAGRRVFPSPRAVDIAPSAVDTVSVLK